MTFRTVVIIISLAVAIFAFFSFLKGWLTFQEAMLVFIACMLWVILIRKEKNNGSQR